MAILLLNDGTMCRHVSTIVSKLSLLKITLKRCVLRVPQSHPDPLPDLLSKDVLSEAEKHQILEQYRQRADHLEQEHEHFRCDLLTLHPGSPQLYSLTATQGPYHVQADPERMDLLIGEAMFGFVYPDASQIKLLLQPQEQIQIPAGVEHWFSPTASLQMKAVRYFASADGWVPQYTGTARQEPHDRRRFS